MGKLLEAALVLDVQRAYHQDDDGHQGQGDELARKTEGAVAEDQGEHYVTGDDGKDFLRSEALLDGHLVKLPHHHGQDEQDQGRKEELVHQQPGHHHQDETYA